MSSDDDTPVRGIKKLQERLGWAGIAFFTVLGFCFILLVLMHYEKTYFETHPEKLKAASSYLAIVSEILSEALKAFK